MTLETTDQEGVRRAYDWADCVVIPVMENLHVSGVTVALEATALGLPVIITATGGMQQYLTTEEAYYVQAGDAAGLRSAALEIKARGGTDRVQKAQDRFRAMDLTTRGYARRHVDLSSALLGGDDPLPQRDSRLAHDRGERQAPVSP